MATAQPARLDAEAIPVVTVCEALHDLSRYGGMSLIVVGRLGQTDEGSWLSEDCERKIVTEGYTWANIISTTYARSAVNAPPGLPPGFKWDERLLRKKLEQVRTTTTLRALEQYNHSDKWVAIFGRLEARLPLQVAVAGAGRLMGYGFGHLNAAPAQLVSADNGFHELKAR